MMYHRTIRLLCTGDLHLGRYPTRVPVAETAFSVAHVWENIVDYAIDQRVDALVLTGDVVDQDNRFFEAFGPLRAGLERLGDAGIGVFAVAGNHDHDVLPGLHDALAAKGFHLVGRGGKWEQVPLEIDGENVLFFAGWSFPGPSVTTSPLDELNVLDTELPVIGLLHGDLHQAFSRYLPLQLSDLNAKPVAAWLLGHIHKPGTEPHRDGLVLYPGSPQPLRTGEQGAHGPWLVEVDGASVRAEQISLATLRYDECEVDLDGAETDEEFRERVIRTVEDHLRRCSAEHHTLRRVVCTIRYVGRTVLHRRVESLDAAVREDIPLGPVTGMVVGSTNATRPPINLETLAQGHDPLGVVAKLILDLDSGSDDGEISRVVRRAQDEMDLLQRKPAYTPLRSHGEGFPAPDVVTVRSTVRDQALLLLDEMYAQKSNVPTDE